MPRAPFPHVDVMVESARWAGTDLDALARRSVAATLRWAGLPPDIPWEVAILACDDARIAALNADFRGRPRPTNVLSWPSRERAAAADGAPPATPDPSEPELGDIAIAHETCAREAAEQGKPFEAHVTHLLVHATLHLLGYDHETDADAALMEGAETRILAVLGLPDPYAGP
jgi:probable rRNA maturation factor